MAFLICCRRSTSNHKAPTIPNFRRDVPPILTLPTELLRHCWSYLDRSDLLRVSRVCHVFRYTSIIWIFQSLSINLQLSVPQSTNQTGTLGFSAPRFTSFYSDPGARELWNIVRAWAITAPSRIDPSTLRPLRSQIPEQSRVPVTLNASFRFLSFSPNICSLVFAHLDLRTENLVVLESLPALESLRLISCLLPSSSFRRPLMLKELEIVADSLNPSSIDADVIPLICNPSSLETLTLMDSRLTHAVLTALLSMEHFPYLKHLNIVVESFSRAHFLRFLAAVPSLTTLRIFHWSVAITPDQPLPPLSSLRSYNGHPDLLSHIVPGRPVDCVCLALSAGAASEDSYQPDNYAIHAGLVWSFLDVARSTVPVRSLTIEYYLPTLEHLTTIASHLPDLHYLEFVLIYRPPSSTAVIAIHKPLGIATTLPTQEDVDLASNLSDTHGTIGVVLSWLMLGTAPLPPALHTLRLYNCGGWPKTVETLDATLQRNIVHCLHSRYPSLREVEMGECRWWREGEAWSREVINLGDLLP